MSNRLLVISPDNSLVHAIKAALDSATSLLQIDQLPENDSHIREKFQPSGILIDSDARSGVQTAFERIAAARRQFPAVPVIALGNEMSAQLVLAALRAGASDFVDRDASAEHLHATIQNALTQSREPRRAGQARIAAVLGGLPSELDQDFAMNLAVRAAAQSRQGMTLYIDLSLPVTQAGIALNITPKFGVADAVRELARLDRVLLEGALACDPQSGLYVMPLSDDFAVQNAGLEPATFAAVLQILQSAFDLIVINYGPFSHQRPLLDLLPAEAQLFLCCSQRFSSVRGAGEMLNLLGNTRRPHLVVHELCPGQAPSPSDIRRVLNLPDSIDIAARWDELVDHFNGARPMALQPGARYTRALDQCLSHMGIGKAPEPPALKDRLRGWLRMTAEPAVS